MNFLAFLEYLQSQQLLRKDQVASYWAKAQEKPECFPALLVQDNLFTKSELKQHLKNFQEQRRKGLFQETREPLTVADDSMVVVSATTTPSNASQETMTSAKNVSNGFVAQFKSRFFRLQDVFLQLPREKRYVPLEKNSHSDILLAKDIWVEREVQLQQITPQKTDSELSSLSEDYSPYFIFQEAFISAQLEHPQILPLYDYQENKRGITFTFRKVHGESFATLFKQTENASLYSERKRLFLFLRICDAIASAHNKGFIHRSLQPTHLYLGSFGEIYVSHWRFAAQIPRTVEKKALRQFPLPTWLKIPPPQFFPRSLKDSSYVAPEVSEKEEVREQEDIYALGKILEEWLLWGRETRVFSKDLQAIMNKASHTNWKQRYESVSRLQEDLVCYQRNLRISIREYSLREIMGMWFKRHPLWAGMCIVSLMMIFFLFYSGKTIFLQKQQDQFYETIQLALQEKEKAVLSSEGPVYMEQMSHLLRALNYLNLALSLQPEDSFAEKEKYEVGKRLIHFCEQLKHYPLAEYVANELSGLTFVSENEKMLLMQRMKQEKQARLEENLSFLKTRLAQLRENPKDKLLRSNILYELSQMKEPEVFETLFLLLQKRTSTLLENVSVDEKEEHFYEALALFVGRLGEKKGADFLLQELKKMEAYITSMVLNEHPLSAIHYMVHLACGLGYTHLHEYAFSLQEIRYHLESDRLFFTRTEKAYKSLLDLDYLKSQHFSDAFSYTMRGLERYLVGDLLGAIADYTEGIRLNPKNPTAYNNRGLANHALKLYEEAITDFNQVLLFMPQDSAAYQNRGLVYYDKGDFQKALADWEELVRLSPDQAESYSNRGNAKKSLGDYPGALADYSNAIELQPNLAEVYLNRGMVKLKLNDFAGALADADYALQLNDSHALMYNSRGTIKKEMKDFEGAILDFSRAISIAPEEPMFYYNRASVKKSLGDFNGALSDIHDAMRLNSKYASAYYLRGVIRKEQGDLNGALRDLDQAIQINKKDAWIYYQRGIVKSMKQLFENSLEDFNEAIRLNPKMGDAYLNRAVSKLNLNQLESGLEDLNTTIALDAKASIAYFNRGFLYRAQGKHELALSDLSLYLEQVAHLNDGTTRKNRESIWKQFPELKK